MSQLKVNSIIPVGGIPTGGTGGIIQVKQTVKSDTSTETLSGGATNTQNVMTLDFTPLSSTSKLLINASLNASITDDSGLHRVGVVLQADGTNISGALGDSDGSNQSVTSAGFAADGGNSQYCITNLCFNYIHTVSNTNQVTYSIRLVCLAGTQSVVTLNKPGTSQSDSWNPRTISTLTIMELSV